jgi:hypothetical protein
LTEIIGLAGSTRAGSEHYEEMVEWYYTPYLPAFSATVLIVVGFGFITRTFCQSNGLEPSIQHPDSAFAVDDLTAEMELSRAVVAEALERNRVSKPLEGTRSPPRTRRR